MGFFGEIKKTKQCVLCSWCFQFKYLLLGILKSNSWYLVFWNKILGTWNFQMKMMRKILIVSQGRASYRWHGCQPRAAVSLLNSTHPTLPNAHTQYHSDTTLTYPILIQHQNTQLMVCNTYCAYPIPQQCIAAVLTYHIFGTNKRCITTLMKKILKKYHNNFSTLIWSRAISSIAVTTAITGRLSSRRYCLWANNSPITTSDTQVTWMLTTALNFSLQSRMVVAVAEDFYWTQAWSLPCLVSIVTESVNARREKLLDLSQLFRGFFKIDTLISLSCYMNSSKLIPRFL